MNKHSFKLPVPDKPITIVLHGTRVLLPGLYHQTTTPYGLHKVLEVGKFRFFSRVAYAISDSDPKQFPLENMYVFGWGGDLSFDVREFEGARLYYFLKKIKLAPEYKNTPITVITHSHGGNVALNCAKAAAVQNDKSLLIDRLIMFAVPVQDMTHDYCNASIFKKVYNFYSRQDMLQVADPQGVYERNQQPDICKTFFSRREFSIIDDKLEQIEVTWGNYPLSHLDFVLSSGFIKRLPKILELLLTTDSRVNNTIKLSPLSEKSPGVYKLDYSKIKRK